MRKDDDNAAMYYKAVMQLDPENKTGFADEARYRLAGYAAAGGDMSKLNEMVASLADDSPWLPRAYSAMAGYSRRNGDLAGAVTAYEAAIKRMPEDVNMMNAYAWFVFKSEMQDQYARAIEVAQKAVELSPEADAIWDTLGQLHFANGNTEAAIEAMSKAAELNPEEKSYKDNLATYRKPKA
ncbi:MAG: tetratricopeptide repeat protein [Calditrichota bacterium]